MQAEKKQNKNPRFLGGPQHPNSFANFQSAERGQGPLHNTTLEPKPQSAAISAEEPPTASAVPRGARPTESSRGPASPKAARPRRRGWGDQAGGGRAAEQPGYATHTVPPLFPGRTEHSAPSLCPRKKGGEAGFGSLRSSPKRRRERPGSHQHPGRREPRYGNRSRLWSRPLAVVLPTNRRSSRLSRQPISARAEPPGRRGAAGRGLRGAPETGSRPERAASLKRTRLGASRRRGRHNASEG